MQCVPGLLPTSSFELTFRGRPRFKRMHRTNHSQFRHSHDFTRDFSRGERRTRIVIAITGLMMVVEITTGLLSHSMALLADGWHMSTHVTAFLITTIAYHFPGRYASDESFSFGRERLGYSAALPAPYCFLSSRS
jgi:Co/Zn/Cd efflux system component